MHVCKILHFVDLALDVDDKMQSFALKPNLPKIFWAFLTIHI